MVKKLKNPIEELGIKGTPIEMPKIDLEAEHQKDVRAYEEWWEKENERRDNIECPVCKTKQAGRVVKTKSNDIIGPGSRSWVTEEYLVCGKCGVMFKDLNKPEREPKYPKRW